MRQGERGEGRGGREGGREAGHGRFLPSGPSSLMVTGEACKVKQG